MIRTNHLFLSLYSQLPLMITYKGMELRKTWVYAKPYYILQYVINTGDTILEYKILETKLSDEMGSIIESLNKFKCNNALEGFTEEVVEL